jgi:transcriptional regulator with XRE-family HTH domain
MASSRVLLKRIEEFENSPDGLGYDLRLDVAQFILRHLDEKNWTQDKLARKAGIKPQQITRLVHSSANFTADTVGKIAFALGTRVRIVEVGSEIPAQNWLVSPEFTTGCTTITVDPVGTVYNEKESAQTQILESQLPATAGSVATPSAA